MDVALLQSAPDLLQTVPEFFDRPYGRLLFGALVLAAVVLVARILLGVTWRLVVLAVAVLALLFVGAAVGLI